MPIPGTKRRTYLEQNAAAVDSERTAAELARLEEVFGPAAPAEATSYSLFTGAGSAANQRMYKKAGFRLAGSPEPGVVSMTKRR